MRQFHSVKRFAALVGVIALLVVFGSVVAQAGHGDPCPPSCEDQFDDAVAVCDANLTADMAGLNAQEAQCFIDHNGDNNGLKGCLNSVQKQRRNALKKHSQCLKKADQDLQHCIQECEASPS